MLLIISKFYLSIFSLFENVSASGHELNHLLNINGDSKWRLQWAGVSLLRKGVLLEGALVGQTLTFQNADQR